MENKLFDNKDVKIKEDFTIKLSLKNWTTIIAIVKEARDKIADLDDFEELETILKEINAQRIAEQRKFNGGKKDE